MSMDEAKPDTGRAQMQGGKDLHIRNFAEEEGYGTRFAGSGVESFDVLASPQPPLADLFRSLAGQRRHITVNSLDGSTVKGIVVSVNADGTVATLENGEYQFVYDIAAVALVQMAKPEERPV